MKISSSKLSLYVLCFLIFLLNIGFWFHSRDFQARWSNVPPVPSYTNALMSGLGDPQLAYRSLGLMMQNLGDTGADSTPLGNYDYERLGEWFMLFHKLDPRSDFIPMLASYYFGATPKTETLKPVIEYLAVAGEYNGSQGEKWRWLSHAAFLARFKYEDLELALEIANKLAENYHEGMPHWAPQMPAFVMAQQGNKEAALMFMKSLLADISQKEDVHPNEVNFMVYYICDRILSEDERLIEPLCQTEY